MHHGKKTWMTANYLKVNDDKSEFIPVVSKSASHLLKGLTISIGEVRVSAVKNVRNLGAYLDCHLDMSHNVAILLKSCTILDKSGSSFPERLLKEL